MPKHKARPLIRTIVKVVDPKIGETVYDPACGSAGFLCEAFTYMSERIESTADSKLLQEIRGNSKNHSWKKSKRSSIT